MAARRARDKKNAEETTASALRSRLWRRSHVFPALSASQTLMLATFFREKWGRRCLRARCDEVRAQKYLEYMYLR